jgi:hypothetical protein
MTLKFTDYVKIENMKGLILLHLDKMGLGEEVKVMNDDDLNKLISLMAQIGETLYPIPDEQRVELLIGYVVSLWAKLIVNYGADLGDL